MRHKTLRLLACASIAAIGSAATVSGAFAQTTVNVPVTLTTSSAITVANTADMDFGSWIMVYDNGVSTLVLDPLTAVVTPTSGGGTTVLVESTASASVGTVTVSTPAAASINHWGSVTVDFADAGLALATLTYSLNGAGTVGVPGATGTTITTTGGTDTITYGGTTTMSATPADAAHTATVQISLEY